MPGCHVKFDSYLQPPKRRRDAVDIYETASEQGRTHVCFSAQLQRFYEIGGACRCCVAHVKGVLGGVQGVQGVVVFQARLKLS
jgi:hypothetical protein